MLSLFCMMNITLNVLLFLPKSLWLCKVISKTECKSRQARMQAAIEECAFP